MRHTIALLAALTVAAYVTTLAAPFVYEDVAWLSASHAWPGLRPPPSRWLTEATYTALGSSPTAQHGANLALHLAIGVVLACAVRRIASARAALLSLMLFWWHPLASESVRYAVGRADLLLTLCAALAAWAIVADRPWLAVWPSLAALLTKEIGAIVPMLAGWTAVAWTGRSTRWLTAGATIGAVGLFLFGSVRGLLLAPDIGATSLWAGFALQSTALWTYAGLFVLPLPMWLSIDHDFVPQPEAVQAIAAAGVLLALLCALHASRLTRWAVVWTMLALAPRFLLGTSETIAERHLGLPLFGVCAALGPWLASWRTINDRAAPAV